jgi:hypothetical protein
MVYAVVVPRGRPGPGGRPAAGAFALPFVMAPVAVLPSGAPFTANSATALSKPADEY